MLNRHFLFLFVSSVIWSCAPVEEPVETVAVDTVPEPVSPYIETYDPLDSNDLFVYDTFNIPKLGLEDRPYANVLDSLEIKPINDKNGVMLLELRGDTIYHPVAMAQYTLNLIDLYRRQQDKKVLKLAEKHAKKLVELSVEEGDGIIFPYTYRYAFYDKDYLFPPWYSGLAQGQVLSVFCRLYEVTQDEYYLTHAEKVFNTMKWMKSINKIWFACIDKERHLWWEEYPFSPPSHVLNGMIFAIYGVYDYYVITGDPYALRMTKGAITTVKAHLPEIRKKGDISYYCLKYPSQATHYHSIHIDQLNYLAKIAADKYFSDMADSLKTDHPYKKTLI